MNTIRLQRVASTDDGTFGIITVGPLQLFTGELPWRDNKSDVSCIPAGVYRSRMTFSSRFQTSLYELFDVPGRFACRIHPANFMGDKSKGKLCQLNGCIALGEKLGSMDGQKAVLVSRPAVRTFEQALGRSPFLLEILPCGVS